MKQRVEEVFRENFARRGEVGAGVSVWRGGVEEVCLNAGWRDGKRTLEWTDRTLALVWSATKGPASACLLHALERAGLELSGRVADIWPEFAQAGKESVTIGQVMSHSAGLAGLGNAGAGASLLDHPGAAAALAAQPPLWPPGAAHGYGPRTFGVLLDECVRRLTGRTLGAYWREVFANPLELEFWIGLPESELGRVAEILPPRVSPGVTEDPFLKVLNQPDSLARRAFTTPGGLPSVRSMNSPEARQASLPSLGGIGTASALGKFYALLASGGAWAGQRFLAEKTCALMNTPLVSGYDDVLCTETSFAAGFQMDPLHSRRGREGHKRREVFGPSLSAFGHPGAGGSLGFADPENGVAFAYVMNQMETGVMPGSKALEMVKAIYREI